MQRNQTGLETGWYSKDLLTIPAVLVVSKCKLSFQLIKFEVKIGSAHSTESESVSVQLREGAAFV